MPKTLFDLGYVYNMPMSFALLTKVNTKSFGLMKWLRSRLRLRRYLLSVRISGETYPLAAFGGLRFGVPLLR